MDETLKIRYDRLVAKKIDRTFEYIGERNYHT